MIFIIFADLVAIVFISYEAKKEDENEVDHSNAVCDGNASISADGDERQYHVGQSDEYG